jgi:xylose isomerase
MDTLARGLMIADDILQNSEYQSLKNQRYKSFDGNKGLLFSEGKLNLEEIASLASNQKEPSLISGKQELFESIINKHIK